METDVLAELIQQKHAFLVQLREMGRKQLASVKDGTMVEVLDILAAKQRVLAGLQRAERAMAPFRGQDPDRRQWRSPELRQACAARLDQCARLLEEILEQEKRAETELVRRRDEAATRLRGVQTAGEARGAYVAQQPCVRSRLDLASEH
jgi:hypothetical protein